MRKSSSETGEEENVLFIIGFSNERPDEVETCVLEWPTSAYSFRWQSFERRIEKGEAVGSFADCTVMEDRVDNCSTSGNPEMGTYFVVQMVLSCME